MMMIEAYNAKKLSEKTWLSPENAQMIIDIMEEHGLVIVDKKAVKMITAMFSDDGK